MVSVEFHFIKIFLQEVEPGAVFTNFSDQFLSDNVDIIRLSDDGLPEDISGYLFEFSIHVYQCHFGES